MGSSMKRGHEYLLSKEKRVFDILLSIQIFCFGWWLFAVIWIAVRLRLATPVIFSQDRAGFEGRTFRMYKFRSMTDERNEVGELLPDSERLTSFGNFLRKSSMDELPEFWNVLKGDMSAVGPRPLLVEYNSLYNSRQRRRLSARPGITGWAQVNGRNAISWEEKFDLDVWYINNASLGLDILILLRTLGKVVLRSGINPAGEIAVEKFKGSSISGSGSN